MPLLWWKRSEGGRGVRNALGVQHHCSLLTFLPVLSDKGNVHLSKCQLVVSLAFSTVFLFIFLINVFILIGG